MVYIILFFIYGLVVGSFCNVVISRLRTGEDIALTQSHCPKCKAFIRWRDNVPVVSFLLLRGKCRGCKKKISLQYPLVECVVGVIFMSVGYFYYIGSIDSLVAAVFLVLAFAGLVVVLVYDLKYMEIPMNVMWISILFIALANFTSDFSQGFSDGLWGSMTFMHLISALVAFCFFFGLSYFSDETWMGYGDAFVAIAIGLLLGPIGTFLALLFAFCVGAIYGIGLMFVKNRSMKTEIPFGPFLILGLYVVFVVQNLNPDFVNLFI